MNSIILNHDSKFGNVIDYDDIANLNNKPLWWEANDTWSQTQDNYYFFFMSELSVPPTSSRTKYDEIKKAELRHCIPYKRNFFDYTTKKTYNTLEEWAADNSKTLNDICYGRADIHFRTPEINVTQWWHKRPFVHYVTLTQLMKFLMPCSSIVCEDDVSCIQEVNIPTNDKIDQFLGQIESLRLSVETLRTI